MVRMAILSTLRYREKEVGLPTTMRGTYLNLSFRFKQQYLSVGISKFFVDPLKLV